MKPITLAVSLALLCLLPAWGRQMTLAEVLAGPTVPLALKLNDLDGAWVRFVIDAQAGDSFLTRFALMAAGGGEEAMPDMYSGVFYTRGETMMIGNVTFLVAYAQQRKTFTQEELEELVNEGWRPIPPTPDTPLSLSLLNLQSCGHLKDIRPFDLASEIRGERWQEAINAEVVTRLRQLSIAVIMYVQDHDEQFPPMRTPEEAKAAVLRYVGNEKLFVHPETGEAYMCNPLLDRIHEAEVKNPLDTVVWYEASPAPDGTRAVSFAGGNARRMPEAEWQQMKQKAGIP